MKEYMIQFKSYNGQRWINISEFKIQPLKTEEEAREELAERKYAHPWNSYRIIARSVTEWEEV